MVSPPIIPESEWQWWEHLPPPLLLNRGDYQRSQSPSHLPPQWLSVWVWACSVGPLSRRERVCPTFHRSTLEPAHQCRVSSIVDLGIYSEVGTIMTVIFLVSSTVLLDIFTWRKFSPFSPLSGFFYSTNILSCLHDYIEPMAIFTAYIYIDKLKYFQDTMLCNYIVIRDS